LCCSRLRDGGGCGRYVSCNEDDIYKIIHGRDQVLTYISIYTADVSLRSSSQTLSTSFTSTMRPAHLQRNFRHSCKTLLSFHGTLEVRLRMIVQLFRLPQRILISLSVFFLGPCLSCFAPFSRSRHISPMHYTETQQVLRSCQFYALLTLSDPASKSNSCFPSVSSSCPDPAS